MLDESVRIFLSMSPEKIDWYKKNFPEEFFNSPMEALQYNHQRMAEEYYERLQEQTIEKQLEEKISQCVEKAIDNILKDFS